MSWELPAKISLREVGPRDGLQNEDPIPTDAKVALVDTLSRTGVARIEAVSFVRPTAIPQMADADEVWSRIKRAPNVRYSALVPNLRGAVRALDTGVRELEVVVSASETHNLKNVNRTTEESLDEIAAIIDMAHLRDATVQVIVATAWGCPYEGDVPVERVVEGRVEGRPRRGGLGVVRRHDGDGDADPGTRAGGRVPRRESRDVAEPALPQHPRHRARQRARRARAGRGGLRRLGGRARRLPYAPGATGNIATEELVHMVEDMGIDTGIDLEAMIEAAAEAERAVGHTLPSQVLRAGPRTRTIPA